MSEPQRWKLSRGSSINGGTGQAEPVTWVTGPRPGRRETIDVVRASALAEAVEAVRMLRDYLTSCEGEGPIRYMDALDLCDAILGLPDEGQS